jgi:hypothetical protein
MTIKKEKIPGKKVKIGSSGKAKIYPNPFCLEIQSAPLFKVDNGRSKSFEVESLDEIVRLLNESRDINHCISKARNLAEDVLKACNKPWDLKKYVYLSPSEWEHFEPGLKKDDLRKRYPVNKDNPGYPIFSAGAYITTEESCSEAYYAKKILESCACLSKTNHAADLKEVAIASWELGVLVARLEFKLHFEKYAVYGKNIFEKNRAGAKRSASDESKKTMKEQLTAFYKGEMEKGKFHSKKSFAEYWDLKPTTVQDPDTGEPISRKANAIRTDYLKDV